MKLRELAASAGLVRACAPAPAADLRRAQRFTGIPLAEFGLPQSENNARARRRVWLKKIATGRDDLRPSGVLLAAIEPHCLDGDGQCARQSVGQYALRNVSKQLSPMRNIVLKGSAEMKHVLASLTIGACLLLPSTGVVFATGQPGTTAGVNCGMTSTGTLATPGHAALSPGAPFNEPPPAGTGKGGKAGTVYAGSGASTGTPASPNAVSQYDVACLQVTTQVP
jgi:hypothetical protein